MGRTGTESLRLALQRLLGMPCYHMYEVLEHPEAVQFWSDAGRGDMPNWDDVFRGYGVCVDWPAAAYWPEITAAYPDDIWCCSQRVPPPMSGSEAPAPRCSLLIVVSRALFPDNMLAMVAGMFGRFIQNNPRSRPHGGLTRRCAKRDAAVAGYEAHNQLVRDSIPPSRLLEWQPGDGWAPICRALQLPFPDQPFPHAKHWR